MRVVEPTQFDKKSDPKKKRRYSWKLIVFVFAILGCLFLLIGSKDIATDVEKTSTVMPEEKKNDEQQNAVTGQLRQFSGNEFKSFYDNLLQPNLDQVDSPPIISGNDIADARIRAIAEQRGYKLRSNPTIELPFVDGYQLQKSVHQPWRALKQAATNDAISMSIVSAYRSVAEQRGLFLGRLRAEGVDIVAVEQGLADDAIDKVLVTSSIPGYSKHHTGYTFDLVCAGFAFEDFKNSPCYGWLSANNYEKAKKFGFIPSYPADADIQGPAPEAWEYAWVGSELLMN